MNTPMTPIGTNPVLSVLLTGLIRRKGTSGQALIELSLCMVVLVLLVFGSLEYGRKVSLATRMATVAREAGRQLAADSYESDAVPDVFNVCTNMIAPSDLENNGRVIISVIERVAGDDSRLSSSQADDALIIRTRYYYPNTGSITTAASSGPDWDSHLPLTWMSGEDYLPFDEVGPVALEMLARGKKTAVVEVFHTNDYIFNIESFLNINVADYLYESAAF